MDELCRVRRVRELELLVANPAAALLTLISATMRAPVLAAIFLALAQCALGRVGRWRYLAFMAPM